MKIASHKELRVYQNAMDAAMRIFEASKKFPKEERYGLTSQIRRSSRSICAALAEAWRKRRYRAAFISKLNDAESEATETQVWLEFAWRCEYITKPLADACEKDYDRILGQLVVMIRQVDKWVIDVR